jgi:hypothetical protein
MRRRVHPIAGVVGFVTILIFWTSTAASEMFGSVETITAVKRAIPWGLLILAPALAITGATGFRMAGVSTDPRVLSKKHRMPFIAGNGLLILVPAALYLAALASRGEFGNVFYGVQAIELVAGAINLTLMALNIRDGLRLAGRFART